MWLLHNHTLILRIGPLLTKKKNFLPLAPFMVLVLSGGWSCLVPVPTLRPGASMDASAPHRTPAVRRPDEPGPGRAVGDGRSQRTRGRRDGRRGRTDLGLLRLGAAPPGAHCRWVARFPQAQARRPLLGWAGAPLPGGSTPDVAKRSALNETRSRMATTAQTAPRLGTTPAVNYSLWFISRRYHGINCTRVLP